MRLIRSQNFGLPENLKLKNKNALCVTFWHKKFNSKSVLKIQTKNNYKEIKFKSDENRSLKIKFSK